MLGPGRQQPTTVDVTLRAFERGDIDDLRAWARSPDEVLQWSGLELTWPLTTDALETYAASASPTRLIWSAFLNPGGPHVGHVELNLLPPEHHAAMIARVLVSPHARGQGVCRSMITDVVRHGFEILGLQRIGLNVFEHNGAAIACYGAVGFRREALLRATVIASTGPWSTVVMGILATDS